MSDPATARQALSDAIARLGQGDEKALAFIYQATSAKLLGICLRILNNRDDAEDALQDVYINLWRSADRFDPARASPISWLAQFARNRSIDRLRQGKVQRGTVPVDDAAGISDTAPLADEQLQTAQRDARIYHCLGALDARTQTAIRTAFFEGRTYTELADAQGVPLGTMKSWVRRGLAKLKRCLDQ